MEAHREGLPTVVQPDRRLTVAVVGLRGRQWCRRGRRRVECWCGAYGGEAGARW
jgi:hypothetical protein